MDPIGEDAHRSADDAEWMGALIVELRRALRRANERTQGSPTIGDPKTVGTATGNHAERRPHTHSEQEVLRYIAAHPGVGTNSIAAALRLSSNTVSSLLSSLVNEGAVRREIDSRDRRKARFLLDEGQEIIRAVKTDRRSASVSLAMQRMDPQARSDLHAALPALAQLVARLDEVGTENS